MQVDSLYPEWVGCGVVQAQSYFPPFGVTLAVPAAIQRERLDQTGPLLGAKLRSPEQGLAVPIFDRVGLVSEQFAYQGSTCHAHDEQHQIRTVGGMPRRHGERRRLVAVETSPRTRLVCHPQQSLEQLGPHGT